MQYDMPSIKSQIHIVSCFTNHYHIPIINLNFGSPNVTFCGYSVPHPLENKMHVHIQTQGIFADHVLIFHLAI
jgi:hypothetical protein